MTRAERAKEAAALRAQGLVYREIAERMGISIGYAQSLVRDPEDREARTRKESYRGTCEDCGARTSGHNGRDAAPKLCSPCHAARRSAAFREHVKAELRRWNSLYGRPPSASDWNVAVMKLRNRRYDSGEDLSARFSDERIAECERRHREDGPWPTSHGAAYAFGSWNAAIEAAGFEPLPSGSGRRVAA